MNVEAYFEFDLPSEILQKRSAKIINKYARSGNSWCRYLSASISGLQQMINTCCVFGDRHCIKFNTNKSVCTKYGKKWAAETAVLMLNNYRLQWVAV